MMERKRSKLNQSGQTMVDLIVALALISGSVASAGTLATSSNRVATDSSHRTEAIGLAEREMEGLRSYRDTFERNSMDWDTTALGYTVGGVPTCSYFVMNITGGDWTPVVLTNTQINYDPASSGNDGGEPALTAKYLGFSRIISACPANDYQQADYTSKNPVGGLNVTTTSHLRKITITTQWLEASGTKTLVERSMLGDFGQ
jgi:type II secretory pathway pseudopilin PulG